ncbi:helix-turn-helix domain-containing protein [Streptomyces coeruleorubidus]|uniref:nSTAND1 domain-containing NTPase n=1 Tax=Streptomyces coeruleorubidus TaxID=116188 RepID=UPI0033F80AED
MGRRERELDPAAGPVQAFAFELRKLRREGGALTYRVLAQRTSYSSATLSRAASGERLPSLAVVLAYVQACGADVSEWEERWHAAARGAAAELQHGEDAQAAPYRGLARFEPADAEMFFGRDELSAQLAEWVHAHRLVAVVGASGSGKSSLLRAGLIPLLRSEAATDRRPAAIRILTPGPTPLSALAAVMKARDELGDTVVVVDQFEELFSLCADPAERRACLDLLLTATDPENNVRAVIAVRADFFGHCAEHHAWAAALRRAILLVGPMSPTELRQAIVRPASAAGLIVERDLTAQIIKDVTEKPGGLPLMSHALLETWRRRKGRALTLTAYKAAGGVAGALAQTAEQLYTRLSTHEARSARHILLRLITPGEGAQDTCRPVSLKELDLDNADDFAATGEVLERLVKARLVTLDGQTLSLAHEALIAAWPRLRGWIDENRESLRLHRRLTEAAQNWEELGRDPGALYRGSRLTAADEHLERRELTGLEHAFLTASLDARDHEQWATRRAAQRLRRLRTSLCVAAALAVIAGLVAWQWNRLGERRLAEATSRRVASVAESLRYAEPQTALRLSVAAWRISPTLEARAALVSALTQPEQDAFTEPGTAVNDPALGHFLSNDGDMLVSGGAGRVRLWNLSTHRLIRSVPVGKDDALVRISPDGRRLLLLAAGRWQLRDATSGAATHLPFTLTDGTLSFGPTDDMLFLHDDNGRLTALWDLRRHRRLPPHGSAQTSGTSREDRKHQAECTPSGELQLWDGGTERRFRSTGPLALAVRLSCGPHPPDRVQPYPLYLGKERLIVVTDSRIRTWDVRTGKEGPPIRTSPQSPVTVTADGDFLTHADRGAILVWRLSNPRKPVYRYPLHGRIVSDVRLEPRHKVIRYIEQQPASTPVVRSLYLGNAVDPGWRTHASEDASSPVRPGGQVTTRLTSVAADPVRRDRMAVGDEYGWVTIWDRALKHRFTMFDALSAGKENKAPQAVSALAYSSDGRILAVAGGSTVRLWDTTTTRPLGDGLLTSGDQVGSLAFSRKGATLTVRGDHTPPRTYPVAPDLVAKAVCARAGSGLSGRDWRAHIPGFPYQRTC